MISAPTANGKKVRSDGNRNHSFDFNCCSCRSFRVCLLFLIFHRCPEDLIAKIIEFLSRDACKGSETSTAYHLDGINAFLGTSFSKDEMRQIYVYLGNGVNHEKTLRFIFSGYDLSVLTEETPCAMSETIQFSVIDTTTGKDPDLRSIVLNEDWAKHLMYCDMEGFAIEQDGTLLLLDECGQFAYCPEGRFKVILEGSR